MSNSCSCRCCRNGCTSCISKEIQNLYRLVAVCSSSLLTNSLFYNRRKPVPVSSLLRKKSCMFKSKRLQIKCKAFSYTEIVTYTPLLREIIGLPLSASFIASEVMSIKLLPFRRYLLCIPYNLRIRSKQDIASPALQLLPFRGIYNFIIFPSVS